MKTAAFVCVCLVLTSASVHPQAPEKKSQRDALQAFNDLIGSWKGTATPAGSREDQQKGFWIENQTWQWQFKGQDTWLQIDFTKSKYFLNGQLRYIPDGDQFSLVLKGTDKESAVYTGKLAKKVLTLDHAGKEEKRRLIFTFLHPNRFLYRYEVQGPDKIFYSRLFQVGATKEGVDFAVGSGKPECIVSGGAGTMAVVYQGQTYYVCCSGCRDEFNENPKKYIKEYEDKKKKK